MDHRDPAPATLVERALTRVPDLPHWVDTRGMLLSGRATVRARAGADPAHDPFIAIVRDAAIASVVGDPGVEEIRTAVSSLVGDVNVLAQLEDAAHVQRALGSWTRRAAIIHTLPRIPPWEAEHETGAHVFSHLNAPGLHHLPDSLRRELADALRGRTVSRFVPGNLPDVDAPALGAAVPIAASWADGRPVAFCYPVWQTERWWDVSIETLEAYRGRGLGARAARALIRHMRRTGRAPVWGALESNAPSLALAAKLGFRESARITVFAAR